MRSRKAQCEAPPDNPETGDTYQYHSRERRSRADQKIEHQNAHRRRSSRGASIYIRVYTSEADVHKPGMYGGSVPIRANACDVFRHTPSRGGRGRPAVVDLFQCVFVVFGISCFFCSLSFRRTHTAYCKYEQYLASCTSLLVCTSTD